ncbi:hypothetical protein HYC85_028535 [Camellia sinensis]|uniref:VOC domain-containing protein n=1 Tax=Camellia sinensis TaxID=4442 RepID=A0A7J7FZG0_CAMSI|nr:hypothetical protein HYC85_028535 [Camellia sinensis]
MAVVEKKLKEMGIECMRQMVEEGGIHVDQLFFHDPDDFMIEICNCDNIPIVPLSGEAVRSCFQVNLQKKIQHQQQQIQDCYKESRSSAALPYGLSCHPPKRRHSGFFFPFLIAIPILTQSFVVFRTRVCKTTGSVHSTLKRAQLGRHFLRSSDIKLPELLAYILHKIVRGTPISYQINLVQRPTCIVGTNDHKGPYLAHK